MANVSIFNNVAVTMETTADTAVAITGITLGATTTIAHSGTDPVVGDYVRFTDMQGTIELNNRVFRVATATSGSFTIEGAGLDSTNFGAHSAGNFQVVNLNTNFSIFRSFDSTGGETAEIDVTTIHDSIQQTVDGLKSAQVISGAALWDPADPGSQALTAADADRAERVFLMSFPNGYKYAFNGTVSFLSAPTGSSNEAAVSPFSIRVRGVGTSFTS